MKVSIKYFYYIGGIAAVVLIITCFFIVDEREVAVVTRFGKPLKNIRQPGLNIKCPWPIDRAICVDTRQLLLKNPQVEILTDDKKNVIVESFLTWKIIDPIQFIETVKIRTWAEERLGDLFTARLGAAIGTIPMESFVNVGLNKVEFHDIVTVIKKKINDISKTNFGISVIDVQLSGFTLPSQNRNSVIARMNAERARIAARYISEGTEQALKIEAKASAEHERILATAHAKAEIILGKAEADSLKIFAAAYEKDPEFFRFLRSLESYKAIIGKETTLFLESDSKLFKVLNGE